MLVLALARFKYAGLDNIRDKACGALQQNPLLH
jgi:hypothetical protein